MNGKRLWKHVRLFLADHLWIILLFLAAPVALLVFYRQYFAKLSGMEDERKQNKLMIYRWVHQLKTPPFLSSG